MVLKGMPLMISLRRAVVRQLQQIDFREFFVEFADKIWGVFDTNSKEMGSSGTAEDCVVDVRRRRVGADIDGRRREAPTPHFRKLREHVAKARAVKLWNSSMYTKKSRRSAGGVSARLNAASPMVVTNWPRREELSSPICPLARLTKSTWPWSDHPAHVQVLFRCGQYPIPAAGRPDASRPWF